MNDAPQKKSRRPRYRADYKPEGAGRSVFWVVVILLIFIVPVVGILGWMWWSGDSMSFAQFWDRIWYCIRGYCGGGHNADF